MSVKNVGLPFTEPEVEIEPRLLNEMEIQGNKAYLHMLNSLRASLPSQCEAYLDYCLLGELLSEAVGNRRELYKQQRQHPLDRFFLQFFLGNELTEKRVLKAENWGGSEYIELTNETDPELMRVLYDGASSYSNIHNCSFQLAHKELFVPLVNGLKYVRRCYPLPDLGIE